MNKELIKYINNAVSPTNITRHKKRILKYERIALVVNRVHSGAELFVPGIQTHCIGTIEQRFLQQMGQRFSICVNRLGSVD